MSHHQEHTDHQFNIMQTQDHSTELGHVIPFRTYLTILISLLILTAVTVAISRVDFGAYNTVIAMVVASIKATLVAMFFMHLKFENKFTIGYAAFPLVLLFILIGGIFLDNPFRADQNGPSMIPAYSGGRIDYSAQGNSAHGEAPATEAHH